MLRIKAKMLKEKCNTIIGKALAAAGLNTFSDMSDEDALLARDSITLLNDSLDYMVEYSEKLDNIDMLMIKINELNEKVDKLLDSQIEIDGWKDQLKKGWKEV